MPGPLIIGPAQPYGDPCQRGQAGHQHGHGLDQVSRHVPQVGQHRADAEGDLPVRYPDVSGPPYTTSSNRATAATDTATEPSHHPSAAAGTAQLRRRGHRHDSAAEHDDVAVADEHRATRAANRASPIQVRRLAVAPAPSTAHSRAPVPAAISEASVNVGM